MSVPGSVRADDIYQPPEEFVAAAFDGAPPAQQVLWIDKAMRPDVDNIMGHHYPILRVRYWQQEARTVWVLEEIGKVRPITTGIIVNDGEIEFLKVLIYRETHGWQVRHDYFTDQFKGLALQGKDRDTLTGPVDNISGATMSVNALRNLAKLALYFHEQVVPDEAD